MQCVYNRSEGGNTHRKCAANFAGNDDSGLEMSPSPPRSGLGSAGLKVNDAKKLVERSNTKF